MASLSEASNSANFKQMKTVRPLLPSVEDSKIVTFVVKTHYIVPENSNQRLAITGDTADLGRWDLSQCVLGTESTFGSGEWTFRLRLHKRECFAWKMAVVDVSTKILIIWFQVFDNCID